MALPHEAQWFRWYTTYCTGSGLQSNAVLHRLHPHHMRDSTSLTFLATPLKTQSHTGDCTAHGFILKLLFDWNWLCTSQFRVLYFAGHVHDVSVTVLVLVHEPYHTSCNSARTSGVFTLLSFFSLPLSGFLRCWCCRVWVHFKCQSAPDKVVTVFVIVAFSAPLSVHLT